MEQSYLWTTGSSGDGASTYTRADWATIAKVLSSCGGYEGVAPDYGENLYPYGAGLNVVQIGTGGALVDGKPYNNSSRANVSIPSAVGTGNRRYDRVVLRCDWTAQSVRITRIAGVDAASPSIPSIVKSTGSTYDLGLAIVLIDTAGNCTIFDDRLVAQVGATGIKAGAIQNYHLGGAVVNANNIGANVPTLIFRQGGSPDNWMTEGTTNYAVGNVKMQAGCAMIYVADGITGAEGSVTFPQSFTNSPLIFLTAHAVVGQTSDTPKAILYRWSANAGYATGFTYHVTRVPNITGQMPVWVSWLAIGPV
jgi:hypothetical protein